MTSLRLHSSSSTFSGSSRGADRFWRLWPAPATGAGGADKDPSEQVEEAGLGGGGIEAESYSSFCFSFSFGNSGNFGLLGGCIILNLQLSVIFQAAFKSCPTLGTPPATVKPIDPAWYIGALRRQTWLPTVISLGVELKGTDEAILAGFLLTVDLPDDLPPELEGVVFFLLVYLEINMTCYWWNIEKYIF
jgi:hypothetical protein